MQRDRTSETSIWGITIMQLKKKAFVGTLSAIAVGAAITLTGGSSAYFIDRESNDDVSIEAGDLDLEYTLLDGGNAVTGSAIELSNVKPGFAKTYNIKVTNNGSVPGTASLAFVNVQDEENGSPEMEGSGPERDGGPAADSQNVGDLGGAINVRVSPLLNQAAFSGMIYQFVEYSHTPVVHLQPGETKTVTIELTIPDHGDAVDQHGRWIDNLIMTDSYTFDVELRLVQS